MTFLLEFLHSWLFTLRDIAPIIGAAVIIIIILVLVVAIVLWYRFWVRRGLEQMEREQRKAMRPHAE